ncbi:1,4-dihydroxy-2-naphthoate polyprenyltransferase [Paenibacillus albiflavus]|uniref:1,4-dihydroxy-2-naphthoate polyprenyltransferase n=1 Tax=Paenibacillus albiflavus TaxID=2545760 RepID=A0A4R4EG34_9BACL|nr:1,4-dihydroxy-2-naphthoate polyprenyltransferase [Paenibacillus albiflavus]TCZ78739.1 1,4-dihydroxy-2-naphthoate polyprenyltransferase [Paenibacillus albiflavus]
MTFQSFMQLVEIRTKVASVIPFAMGTIYAIYRFQVFQPWHFLLMLISLLSFDMATTAINNYMDYRKAVKTQGYGYEVHNAIVQFNLKERTVLTWIGTLIGIAVVAGFILFLQTSLITLLLGGLSFMIGILYSFGPIPISRMPLGELFSGLFMGFVIMFIAVYVEVPNEQLVALLWDGGYRIMLDMNILEILLVLFISIPAILGIANIMLANNTCDIEDDIENKRYTLPVYIGKNASLKLFRYIYYLSYIDVIFLLLIGIHPLLMLLIALTLFPVQRNLNRFISNPSKQHTFHYAVKNFILMNCSRILVIGLAAAFNLFA